MTQSADTVWIVEQAKGLGFDLCGVVRAEKFPELENIPEWLGRGYAGEMKYLSDPRREDPRAAMPAARSVIVCMLNYNTEHPLFTDATLPSQGTEPRGWISRYAWGADYHEVLAERLDKLIALIREQFPEPFDARAYVDTGPVQERVLAKHAGLGWLGKNTLLLNETLGSYFFLGVILTTLELEPALCEGEMPPPDLCGSCRQCLDACPTQAFVEPYLLDARKCISYLTIELRGSIPEELRGLMGSHVFGCDICQDVCPWNRRAPVTDDPHFQPRQLAPPLEKLAEISEEDFRALFRGSPVKRAKYSGFLRNVAIAMGNSRKSCFRTPLKRLSQNQDAMVAEAARWALDRLN